MDIHADPSLMDRLAAIVGEKHVLTEPDDTQPYRVEWRGLYHGSPAAVVRPGSVAEVAALVKLAQETATPIVPQSGNTGLVGAQVPDDSGRELIVSLQRLDKVRAIDVDGRTATVEILNNSSDSASNIILRIEFRKLCKRFCYYRYSWGSLNRCRFSLSVTVPRIDNFSMVQVLRSPRDVSLLFASGSSLRLFPHHMKCLHPTSRFLPQNLVGRDFESHPHT